MVTLIAGWRVTDSDFASSRYNGGKDPAYAEKVSYCFKNLG